MLNHYILTLSCEDDFGIVAAVSGVLTEMKGFIVESSQFGDASTGQFFMRTEFSIEQGRATIEGVRKQFTQVANRFHMQWQIHSKAQRLNALVLASKLPHCLNDLMHRTESDLLSIKIKGVVSNHPDLFGMASRYDLPFHCFPVTDINRSAQEAQLMQLVKEQDIDLVILARYMQILSPELCEQLSGRAINIHHSFLPSFQGSKPYHQAFERGVKLIGATAHYVTEDLDGGPIIEQETMRVSHSSSANALARIGHDLETLVLARAVQLHAEHRILLNGEKTVVFN